MMENLKIEIDDNKRLVRVFHQGTQNMNDALQMVSQARAVAHQKSYNLLYDLRNVQFNVNITELYYLPRNSEIFKDTKSRLIKSANVFSSDVDPELLDFMQTTAINAGMNWKSFPSIEEALAWLE